METRNDGCNDLQLHLDIIRCLIGPWATFHEEVQLAAAQALHFELPFTEASPTVLELDCGLRCNLVQYSQVRMTHTAHCVTHLDNSPQPKSVSA